MFAISTARVASDGQFQGIVSIALRPSYFSGFYQELMGDTTPLAIALVRDDGLILAQWSPGKNGEPLAHAHAALTSLSPRLPVPGVAELRSSVEGGQKIIAYRRVAGYPVLVVAAYPMSSVYAKWRAHMLFASALVLMPCAALVLVLGLCLRHLRHEERAWDMLSARVQRQRALEAAQKETLRLQALGKLVGTVAHDFNNLLMTVSANVELGKRLDLANFQPQLEAMERAIHRGVGLTRRLLGVARKQPLRNEILSLQSWGKDFGLVRASLPARIDLRLDTPDDAWAVEVDPAEFELAILNIALNARDAISGEGWFSIAARNVTVDETSTLPLEGEFLCITLTDNGTGMNPEVLRHAFEPLFTTKPMGKGTGLGLAHVQSFCDQAGGAVELSSELGKGTTLKLYLPRATRIPTARAADVTSAPESDAPSLSILLVEDNDEVAAAEQAVLQVLGHTVHREPEAGSALARLQERVPFDCVVSDIQMPGDMNGIDLAKTVRSDFPHLPVVLVTGCAEELERAKQTGLTVLPKPFSIDALKQTLARAARARERLVRDVPGGVSLSGGV